MEDHEQFLNSLPEQERTDFVGHEFTLCKLDGEIYTPPIRGVNLFDVISEMKRYVVDTNSNWKADSAKPTNRDKAFIISKTVADEQDNLLGLFFGPKVNLSNNNLFVLGVLKTDNMDEPAILLERLDRHYRGVFNEESLQASSKSRAEKLRLGDKDFIDYEKEMASGVEHEKKAILLLLGKLNNVSELPEPSALTEMRARMLAFIQGEAANCAGDFMRSAFVARHCYALLLAEKLKMRTEFAKPDYINVFGDTRIIQIALFMQADILSGDRAVKRMAGYAGLECVSTV